MLLYICSFKFNLSLYFDQNFYFTGEIYALNPTISFKYVDKIIILVIKWCHIGDDNAQKYTLILNDMEIKHVSFKSIK